MQGPEPQNIEEEISKPVQDLSAAAATVSNNDAATSTARCKLQEESNSSGDTHGWHRRLHVVRTSPRPTLTTITRLVNSIREGSH